jgi:hypothetical protein
MTTARHELPGFFVVQNGVVLPANDCFDCPNIVVRLDWNHAGQQRRSGW